MMSLLQHCEKQHEHSLGIAVQKGRCYTSCYKVINMPPGVQHLQFTFTLEFEVWKENEEEATYSSYVKGQQSYHPTSNNTRELKPYEHSH